MKRRFGFSRDRVLTKRVASWAFGRRSWPRGCACGRRPRCEPFEPIVLVRACRGVAGSPQRGERPPWRPDRPRVSFGSGRMVLWTDSARGEESGSLVRMLRSRPNAVSGARRRDGWRAAHGRERVRLYPAATGRSGGASPRSRGWPHGASAPTGGSLIPLRHSERNATWPRGTPPRCPGGQPHKEDTPVSGGWSSLSRRRRQRRYRPTALATLMMVDGEDLACLGRKDRSLITSALSARLVMVPACRALNRGRLKERPRSRSAP